MKPTNLAFDYASIIIRIWVQVSSDSWTPNQQLALGNSNSGLESEENLARASKTEG
jgi:hypothetical protein